MMRRVQMRAKQTGEGPMQLWKSLILTAALAFCSCCGARVDQGSAIPFSLNYLLDDSHSYKYVGERAFLTMRDVTNQMRLKPDQTELHGDSLGLVGMVMDRQTGLPLSGVEIYVGGFDSRTGLLSGMDSNGSTPVSTFHITASKYYTTDSSGAFRLSAQLNPQSLLMLAKPGYLMLIYKVGRLVQTGEM
jgi:hypothetical protein